MRKCPMFSSAVRERAVHMVFDTKDQYPSQVVAESNVSLMGLTVRSSVDGEWLQPLYSRRWPVTSRTAAMGRLLADANDR